MWEIVDYYKRHIEQYLLDHEEIQPQYFLQGGQWIDEETELMDKNWCELPRVPDLPVT